MLFKAVVSGIKPKVFDNKIKTNNTNSQFMKFIFLKKIAFFKLLLNTFNIVEKNKKLFVFSIFI